MIQPKRSAAPKMTNCSSHICAVRLNLWTRRSLSLLFSVIDQCVSLLLLRHFSAPLILSWTPWNKTTEHERKEAEYESFPGWRTCLHPWTHSDGPSHSETTCLGAGCYFHFRHLCQILKSICVWRCVHVANVLNRHREPQSGYQISLKEKNRCGSSLDLRLVAIDCLSLNVSDTGREPRGGLGRDELCLRLSSLFHVGKKECL